jgi:hypothetical protein
MMVCQNYVTAKCHSALFYFSKTVLGYVTNSPLKWLFCGVSSTDLFQVHVNYLMQIYVQKSGLTSYSCSDSTPGTDLVHLGLLPQALVLGKTPLTHLPSLLAPKPPCILVLFLF